MRTLPHLRVLFIICIAMTLALAIVQVSAAEDLTVSFMSASGATTANTYSGQVQISVTGTGQSSGIAFNDAFYVFTSYTDGTTVTPYVQVPFHLYINGQSVTAHIVTVAPAYNTDHCYTFTIDPMRSGAANDNLDIGVTKTYRVNNKYYEVTVIYIDGTHAKFTVNGVSTALLLVGETDLLADGSTKIGVSDILYQDYAGGVQSVEFYLDATPLKLTFKIGDGYVADNSGSFTVRVGGTSLCSVCTNDCSPSGTKTCSGIGYKTCGNYDADSCLDWSNVTSCSSGTTCVNGVCVQQAVAKADLTVTDIVFTPANPTEGDNVGLESKVANLGNKASGVVNIKGYIDGVLVAYGSFGPLQPGATVPDYSNNVGWGDPWVTPRGKAVAGTHTFRFVIDADNHEAESNETNNAFEKTLQVAQNVSACTNDCSPSGTKTCSGTTGYKTCGNYDADSCLEWSNVTSCASGESCTNGFCEPPQPVPNETRTCPANKPYLQCDRYLGSTPGVCTTAADWNCCGNNYDCVYEGVCFKDHYYASCNPNDRTSNSNCVDTNDKSPDAEVCGDFWGYTFIQDRTGKWGDQDFDSGTCGVNCPQGSCKWMTSEVYCEPVYRWQSISDGCDDDLTPSHEDPTGKNYCCGDDPKEYYKTGSDGTKACCAASDRVVSGGICYAPDACTNDCSPSGTKTCSGIGYKTCGNYDADSCLEWSNVTSCASGETCAAGTCTAAVFCGNGVCDTGENCGSCAGDCACGASQLCCGQQCVLPACRVAGDCNDKNALTTDTCSYGGSCNAICTNKPCTVRCSSNSECNDASSVTTDTCSNPGTCSASCMYEMCTIICTSNTNCDDTNPNTADTCSNPGTCSASCVHAQNPSYDNNGVCDVNVGENCLSAPGDCDCAAGQFCKPSRATNVNGCAKTECGDGYLDPGEDNCCADAGCGPGLFCDWAANACIACRTDNDCEVGYCTANTCVECRSNTDCESGLCEAGACVECLVDEHCSARRIWDPSPECTNDQHSVFQRGKIIEGKCNKNSHKCVGQEKVIQRNVRDCSPDYCQEGKCGCTDGFIACEAAGRCVAKNGLENGKECGCDEQCAGGFCQEGLCRAPSLNLSAKNPNLKMGVENEVFFSIKNPFDEEIEFTIMLSVGAGVDVSKVLACDEAIGSLCKVTRKLLPGASTSLSLGVLPQSLEQSVSVQGTVAYTYRDKTLEVSQEMSLGSEGGVGIVELPVRKTGVKALLQSTLFTIVVATLLATTGIGYVYRNRLTIGARIEDLLDSLRSDREERRELRPSMPNREEVEAEEQLRNYIIKARAKGHSDEVIRNALLKKGWDSQQVKNGLKRK